MRMCVAQTKPVKGDIETNIEHHKRLIDLAVSNKADVIIFPELSLTGYEPALAKELATTKDDERFDVFQNISDNKQITIGVGVPTKNDKGICISMIIFHRQKPRQVYSKKYLHADEEPFFISGENDNSFINSKSKIAIAICYEISVHEHAEYAFKNKATIYIASVAKFVRGIDKAIKSLSEIAEKYSMTVLMSNCIGECDGEECAGKTSAWDNRGILLGQLDDNNEGILITDTETKEVIEKRVL